MSLKTLFNTVAKKTAYAAGTPWVFGSALLLVLTWAASGPMFGFDETWQLVINTGTTIITFLMVFLIQHTQNADTAAMQIKLDELIRATKGADNTLLDLEELDEQRLEAIRRQYEQLAAGALREQQRRAQAARHTSA